MHAGNPVFMRNSPLKILSRPIVPGKQQIIPSCDTAIENSVIVSILCIKVLRNFAESILFLTDLYFRVPFNLLRRPHDNGQNYKQSCTSGKEGVFLQLQQGKKEEIQACLQ